MSEYCDFFPNDPQCVKEDPKPTPTDNTDDGAGNEEPVVDCEGEDCPPAEMEEGEMAEDGADWHEGMTPFQAMMHIDALMHWANKSPIMGQINYTLTAAVMITNVCLYAFRYSTVTDYYKAFSTDAAKGGTKTEWYKIGSYIGSYGNLAIYGAAFITSLMALFGVMPMINVYVWVWGVFILGGIIEFVQAVFTFIQFDEEASLAKDSLKAAYDAGKYDTAAALTAIYSNIRTSFIRHVAISAAVHLNLFMNYDDWMSGMWDAMSDEDKAAKIKETADAIEEMNLEYEAMEMEMEEGEPAAEDGEDVEGEEGDAVEGEEEDVPE